MVVAIVVGILVGILVLRVGGSADQVPDDRDSWADLGRAVLSIVLGVVVGVLVWIAGLVRSSRRLFRRGERLGGVILSVTAAFALTVLVNVIAGALDDGAGLPSGLSDVLIWLGVAVVGLGPSAVFRLWDARAGAAVTSIAPSPASDTEIRPTGTRSPYRDPGSRRRTSVTRCAEAAIRLPVRSRNGTPRQRSLSIHSRAAMNVSVVEPSATDLSSRYPSNCPSTTSCATSSSRKQASASSRARARWLAARCRGGSIATSAATWNRCDTIMSRAAPVPS